jgi:tetratricopeptide (TPR) repeat protein
MTETLINSLSQIPELSVKARSSVFRYKGKDVEPQQIGNELSVQAILNGRVLQRADNITLNLELVDVRTGNQIWGEQYNRKTTDLVSLQGEIARDVLNKLQKKLTGAGGQSLAKKPTTDSEAYQLYLKGLFHWNRRTADELNKAIEYFNQAKEKDPSFALAYAGLAVTYSVLPSNTFLTKEETSEAHLKAKAAALKALELDNTLAEAHAVLGSLKVVEWDFAGAENEFKRAIELNPNYATAHQWYSELLARLGRNDEALAEVKKAYELDPFSTAVNMNLGLRYAEVRRVDEAFNQFKKTIEISPDYPMTYWMIGDIYFEKGMYEESFAAYSKGNVLLKLETPESAEQKNVALKQALKTEGVKGYWRKILEFELDLYERGINSPFYVAAAYAKLGEREKVYEWLEKSYAERDFNLTYLKTNRNFDDLRSDPRYQELVRKVGLSQ